MAIEPDNLVDDVMREWPETIRVFLEFRMRCVGCPIGAFHTVDDACREHGVDRARFLAALRARADLVNPPVLPPG
jgi:hybrid cluster-associated redox disulfide protein